MQKTDHRRKRLAILDHEQMAAFEKSKAVASLLLVQPTASFDLVETGKDGVVKGICPLTRSDIWINGGFFIMKKEIFNYIQPGEELVRRVLSRTMDDGVRRRCYECLQKLAYQRPSTPAPVLSAGGDND